MAPDFLGNHRLGDRPIRMGTAQGNDSDPVRVGAKPLSHPGQSVWFRADQVGAGRGVVEAGMQVDQNVVAPGRVGR